jgi:flagellar motor switch protein FliM
MSAPAAASLDPDAIAALFAAAEAGQLPEPAAEPEGRGRAPRVRAVDFRRPRQFTTDVQRRLRRALGSFSRTASSRLSAELRMPVDLEVVSTDQLTWSDAHSEIPDGSPVAVLQTDPLGTRLLLAAELPLVLSAIERMLGGGGGLAQGAPARRRLSDIDMMLAGQFFESIAAQLSAMWGELVGGSLAVADLTGIQQTAQLAATTEPTLAFTIEVRLLGLSNALILLLPYRSVSALLTPLQDADAGAGGEAEPWREERLRGVEVEVRAEAGAVELTVDELLALKPGDRIPLGVRADQGVTLSVDGAVLERARPGRNGPRRAVQVLGPGEGAR